MKEDIEEGFDIERTITVRYYYVNPLTLDKDTGKIVTFDTLSFNWLL